MVARIFINEEPVISDGLKTTDVLWRYLDAAKLLDFLQNQTLFFCRGDEFDDKHEGAFTELLRDSINSSYSTNNIAYTFDEFKRTIRSHVFVNCWHRSPDDSMAMWRIYGISNCSVALTTTVGKLQAALREQRIQHLLSIEKVQYVKHWRNPELDISPYSRVFAYKTKAYDFEKEVRVLIDRSVGEFDDEIAEIGMAIKISQKTLLRSIVISPEAPPWFDSLVRAVAEKFGITAPVRRSKLATDPV